jgi:hypothetical protein
MKYASPRTGRQVRLRYGKTSLLLATYGSDEIIVNNSLSLNLANELRRFFEQSKDPCELTLQITEGEQVLTEQFPEPDGLNVLDAADLIASRARLQCCLDNLRSSQLPACIDPEEQSEAKLNLVRLIQSCDAKIKLQLSESIDERHDADSDVRS